MANKNSKSKKKRNRPKVIIERGRNNLDIVEIECAQILADYFKKDVVMIKEGLTNTADYLIGGKRWELKTPRGKSASNIETQFRRAKKQSKYIVLNLRESKMNQEELLNRVRYEAEKRKEIKGVLVIIGKRRVIEIK